jgi:hypothetical protein
MRWGVRKQQQHAAAHSAREDEREKGGEGKGRAFSFSPLSWLGELPGKEKPGPGAAANKHAAAAGPSCLPKRSAPLARQCSPPRRSPDADDVVPRRLSVGNDNTARSRSQHRRRHCSLGGDCELLPLGHLIPFSLSGSPALPPPPRPTRTEGQLGRTGGAGDGASATAAGGGRRSPAGGW